jgi:signal transduction histidine kinase
MSAQPAALYGPPVGGQDETVVGPTRVLLTQGALVLAGLLAGAESAAIASRTRGYSMASSSVWAIVLTVLAGWALVAAGVVLLRRAENRAAGALMSLAGLTWLVAGWDSAGARSAWVFGAGLVLATVCPVLVAHAVLRMEAGLGKFEAPAVVLAYVCTVVVGGLAKALFFNPGTAGCSDCPANPWLVVDSAVIVAGIDAFARTLGVIWSGFLVAVLVLRSISYTPAQRRILLPVTAIAIGYLMVVLGSYVLKLSRGAPAQGAADDWLWLAQAVLLVAVAGATAWPAIALRVTRFRLVRLLVQGTRVPPIGGLSTALAAVLHDPSALLLYPLADGQLVDAAGIARQMPADETTATSLMRGEKTVAYLIHRPGALDDGTVGEVVRAARLGLENERLHAEREAQLRALRESLRRIVATADRERRTLERDLHDGAQQKVVALALALRLARLKSAPEDLSRTQLLEAEHEVGAALAELRTVARGLFPTELADEGLEAALDSFAESSSISITTDVLLPRRLPSAVESAAFFAVVHLADASRSGGRIFVRVGEDGLTLRLEITTSQPVQDLTAVEDRVGALGGTVEATTAQQIRVELPCES